MADLLYTAILEKMTGETFDEVFDFDGIIPESRTVVTATVTVTKVDGTDATASVYVSKTISSATVTVKLNTGSTETAYLIRVAVVVSDASTAVQTKLLNVTTPGVYR